MEKRCVIKNIVYFLEIMLMFVVQQIPLLSLQYFGVRAILIIPAFVCVSVFMNEKQALVLFRGYFWIWNLAMFLEYIF